MPHRETPSAPASRDPVAWRPCSQEVESRAEEKKAQEGKEKGKIAEGKKGSLKKQDAKETRKRVVEAIQTEAKARGPKESAEETAERGADAAAAGKDTGDEAAAGETCAWAAVTSPPHTGADSAAISRETSKSSQDSSAASVVAAKWDSPTWAGIEDGARVRGGHQRSSTWAQLEAELLSQTLGEGAAMSPLGPGSRAMSGLGWNEGAGAQVRRGGSQ